MLKVFQFYPIEWPSADDDDAASSNELTNALISPTKDGKGAPVEASPFVHSQRPKSDVAWWRGLVVGFFGVVISGIVLQFYRNANFDALISKESLNDPANCPIVPASLASAATRKLLDAEDEFRFQALLLHKAWWIALGALGTLTAGILVGTMVLRLFESKPEVTVKSVTALQLALPLAGAAYLFAAGRVELAAVLVVFGIANIVCVCIWGAKLPLLARLVHVACSVVTDNPNLFWVSLLTQVAIAAASALFFFVHFVVQRVGSLAHNPLALPPDSSAVCRHILTNDPVSCCAWQTSGWGQLHMVPTTIIQAWVVSFILEAQTYVISGTVCQWYFAPVSATSCRGNVARSGKHLRSSLGTVALGSLVLYWVRLLRTFTYINDRRLTWKNPISYLCGIFCCLYFCVSCCITPCIDRITKYATHRTAISGNGFSHSNASMYNTLRCNRLNHIGMGWVPPFILRFSSTTIAITTALLAAHFSTPGGTSFLDVLMPVFLRVDLVFVIVATALSLVSPLLLGIIDSLYVCFALDREQQTCSKSSVHDIFTHVPSIGPIWDDDDPNTAAGMVVGVPQGQPSTSGLQYSAPATQHV